MSKKRLTEQEYEEKNREFILETWGMINKAQGAKTQREQDRYMQKALKTMVEHGRFYDEYNDRQEQEDEQQGDDDNGYYDDGL